MEEVLGIACCVQAIMQHVDSAEQGLKRSGGLVIECRIVERITKLLLRQTHAPV